MAISKTAILTQNFNPFKAVTGLFRKSNKVKPVQNSKKNYDLVGYDKSTTREELEKYLYEE